MTCEREGDTLALDFRMIGYLALVQAALDHLHRHLNELTPVSMEETRSVLDLSRPLSLSKGEFMFTQGSICRTVAHVHRGCLRYFTTSKEGNERILYFAMEEWWVGDLESFYSNEPSGNSLQAIERCELITFNREAFEQARNTVEGFRRFIDIKWRKAYTGNQERTFTALTLSPEEHYERFLTKYGDRSERIPLYHVAAYLGITPEALSRIRARRVGR